MIRQVLTRLPTLPPLRYFSLVPRFTSISTDMDTEMETGKPTPKRPRRFAPLNPQLAAVSDAPRLQGIVFDVDGTLWYVCDCLPLRGCVWCMGLGSAEAGDFPSHFLYAGVAWKSTKCFAGRMF